MTPLSAFVESPDYVGPVLVLDWTVTPLAICATDDGHVIAIELQHVRADVRYDWNAHHWVDVNGVTDAEEDASPDGGAPVP